MQRKSGEIVRQFEAEALQDNWWELKTNLLRSSSEQLQVLIALWEHHDASALESL